MYWSQLCVCRGQRSRKSSCWNVAVDETLSWRQAATLAPPPKPAHHSSQWDVLMLPSGQGFLGAHVGDVLFQLDDPLLLAAHQLLQRLDLLQHLLQLGLRLLKEKTVQILMLLNHSNHACENWCCDTLLTWPVKYWTLGPVRYLALVSVQLWFPLYFCVRSQTLPQVPYVAR